MRGEIRKIDPNLGLHELANSFQLRSARHQAEELFSNLDNLVENTFNKVPMRAKDFCLDRVIDPELTHEEDKWERAMYRKWGPEGSGEYVSSFNLQAHSDLSISLTVLLQRQVLGEDRSARYRNGLSASAKRAEEAQDQ